jgi:transposase
VAVLDTRTGEVNERQLGHDGRAVEEFYAALPGPVTVGIESTGYALWFHALMQRLGHTLLVGDAAKIRAMVVRKTKTDRRDARHILDLLRHDRFPTIWMPDPVTRDPRALLTHRMRLVRIRTMVKNGLHAIALNYRLVRGSKLLRQAGLAWSNCKRSRCPCTPRSAGIRACSCSPGSTPRSGSSTTRSPRRPWRTPMLPV